MYPYDENDNLNESETAEPKPELDDSEYHIVRPDSGRSWRDADYTPQSETTAPRRYFVPEEKPPKAKRTGEKSGPRFARVACLCLCCALIGGAAGGAVTSGYLKSGSAAEATASPVLTTPSVAASTPAASQLSSGSVSAGDIYTMGCEQVVGITTEITSTNVFGMTVSGAVSGSGFIISQDGYIMTNYHVIESAYKGGYDVEVMLHSGDAYTASIVGFDEDNDVAVLKIDAYDLNAVTLGNSDAISVGDTVYAIGNPLGELAYSMTSGMVSATGRTITTSSSSGASINMFQIDAAVNEGNSGGPVYNTSGQVVGVVTAKYSDTGVEGLGFAIPINDAVNIANQLITNGYVSGKAYMGVNGQTVSAGTAQYYNMAPGVYIYNVEAGSAAETAGLKIGDVITEMGGVSVSTWDELRSAVKSHSAGDTISMTVWRSGEYQTLTITFDEALPQESASVGASSGSGSESDYSAYPNVQGW